MKLHAEDRSLLVTESADRIPVALRCYDVTLGRVLDVIAVTHPRRDWLAFFKPGEQSLWLQDLHPRPAVLAAIGADHFPALDVGDELHSVADPQHRRDIQNGWIGERNVVAVNG